MELSSPKSYIFSKKHFSYISGGNLQSPKNKKFLHFKKWNFLAPRLKKVRMFF